LAESRHIEYSFLRGGSHAGDRKWGGPLLFCCFGLVICAAGKRRDTRERVVRMARVAHRGRKPPSEHEFAAVLPAREERAKNANHIGALEGCLADYGL
jgi:hypothetical protein